MNDAPPLEPDPLTALLAVSRSDANALQQEVLRRTSRVVRHRRWLRRSAIVAALAACYGAGLATMRWLTPPPGVVEVVVVKEIERTPSPVFEPAPRVEESAVALEWNALDHPEKTVEYYRRAGDRYLADPIDLQAATRCYKQMLDAGTEEDWTISPDDNWLLMALKDARLKEKLHANAN